MADVEAIGRLISLALRSGISIQAIHRQLRGIASDRAIGLGPNKVLSVPDAIGIAIESWIRQKQGVQQELLKNEAAASSQPVVPVVASTPVQGGAQGQYEFESVNQGESYMGTCPDCGSQMEFAEGCAKCHVCGFSECG
jgi:ribonucleoside-diphosphate reductase alpha chain